MKLDKDWGVVQELKIEADIFPALRGACMIACADHKNASHFIEGKDEDGGNYISLRWTDGRGAIALPFDLNGPEEMADFLKAWLLKKSIMPNDVPDTDGSVNEGFRAEMRDFYDVLTVKPIHIVYSK